MHSDTNSPTIIKTFPNQSFFRSCGSKNTARKKILDIRHSGGMIMDRTSSGILVMFTLVLVGDPMNTSIPQLNRSRFGGNGIFKPDFYKDNSRNARKPLIILKIPVTGTRVNRIRFSAWNVCTKDPAVL